MAEEKTRIFPNKQPAGQPAGAGRREPDDLPGKIVFRCSNGHRIVERSTSAGKKGRCSKCGVAVEIPAASQPPGASPAADAEERVAPAAVAGSGQEFEQKVGQEPGRESRDGRFSLGGGHAPPQDDVQESVGQSESRVDMFAGLGDPGGSHLSSPGFIEVSGTEDAVSPEAVPLPPEFPVNPTAILVARLFEEMNHGGIVEVHVNGGSVILPEFYEPRWSSGSHGLFASRAADGTVTLTAVAWDAIQKIVVRQVEGLPDGMFE